ncbi:MAG TPA: hypothetical protein DDW90_10725 [Cyanobacteria bacterium UBA9971]|nr:hypothetical protein [Cyanobacteria bacterium UBA9971]
MSKVFKRKWKIKNGEKSCWAFDYLNTFGKRKIVSGFSTKQEAEREKANILSKVNNGIYVENNKFLTFADMAEKHMKFHAEIHCKLSTYHSYVSYLKNHIFPLLADMRAIEITPNTINEYIKVKQDEKLSNSSINKHLALIGAVFQSAINEGLLSINPVYKVKKLKEAQKEMEILTKEEIYAALETAKKHYPDFYPLLLTAIFTGMRRGELLALTWDKINWVMKQIKVDRSVYSGQFVTPKTPKSKRRINMTDELVKVLKEWRLRCPNGELNLVFPNNEGKFMDEHNLKRRKFVPVLRRAGVNQIRFHDLRHTFASLLLAENLPAKYIQDQLGHSSIKTTMDRYSHLMPEVHQQGIKALNDFFGTNKIPEPTSIYKVV